MRDRQNSFLFKYLHYIKCDEFKFWMDGSSFFLVSKCNTARVGCRTSHSLRWSLLLSNKCQYFIRKIVSFFCIHCMCAFYWLPTSHIMMSMCLLYVLCETEMKKCHNDYIGIRFKSLFILPFKILSNG